MNKSVKLSLGDVSLYDTVNQLAFAWPRVESPVRKRIKDKDNDLPLNTNPKYVFKLHGQYKDRTFCLIVNKNHKSVIYVVSFITYKRHFVFQ